MSGDRKDQPAELAFVVDELLLEAHVDSGWDAGRLAALRAALLAHVEGGADLTAHLDRLLAACDEVHPAGWAAIAESLCELPLCSNDATIAERVGARPELRAVIVRRVRPKRHALSGDLVRLFLDWASPPEGELGAAVCLLAYRMAKAERDVAAFVPWLIEALEVPGRGRGRARIDVGRDAALALRTYLEHHEDPAIRAALDRTA